MSPVGPRADLADDLRRHRAAEPAARRQIAPLRVGIEEAGGVGVAGAGRVDDLHAWHGVDDVHLVAVDDDRALLAAGQRRDLAVRRAPAAARRRNVSTW